MFIYSEIPQQFSSTVCSAHFTSDCFVNQAQKKSYSSKMLQTLHCWVQPQIRNL